MNMSAVKNTFQNVQTKYEKLTCSQTSLMFNLHIEVPVFSI